MFLTDEEIIELTGKRRRDAQVRVLRFLCLEHRVRPDGSLVVLRSHVEQTLNGLPASRAKVAKDAQPNWSAINA